MHIFLAKNVEKMICNRFLNMKTANIPSKQGKSQFDFFSDNRGLNKWTFSRCLQKLVKTTSKVKVFYTGLNGVTLGLPLDIGLGPLALWFQGSVSVILANLGANQSDYVRH